MQLHNLKPVHSSRKKKRVGRGGKRGKTSGRGGKGQTARAGAKIRPAVRDIIKRVPKLRGYRFKSWRTQPQVVNLDLIAKKFKAGDVVSPTTLKEKGLIRSAAMPVKILGRGKLEFDVKFEGVKVSRSVSKNAKLET